ncbi:MULTISPECIES: amidohydrolase family protein [Pseudonocardia]|uniref:2-pyrone-4,6-dicarbaxylate hydrolase n=2 Tax=Pseudonocardia TaxID=1847 RepID=A0A1Y2MKS6_PSEAH|nr:MULTISPECIES: amidohydrolase family protein [Pseudonocardia]OSY35762.1 2-pyrone-4,6-dicarbaxylate hydrolase [Pseudonocardia autotrophica]TDN74546.1 putative TIM-barrel fold metal-dependent hydrolase [Pseudonocardia autotrophica]BBG05314.1 metal-dependent hydrolase [Pseudonocardia autotrophica]GEC27438.1 metal-dependent hydrolase [Pseudonocardia saturnea]
MLIDAHAHLVTDEPGYPHLPGASPNALMPVERLLEALRDNGADAAIAVQRAHVYGFDNSYVLDAAARHPDRVRAMCVIDGQAPDAVGTVHRLAERGAVAIRLTAPGGDQHGGPAGTGWFAGPEARAVWAAAADTGLSMCLHIYRWNSAEVLRGLPAVLDAVPGVPVVLDHIAAVDVTGPPAGAEPLLALTDHEQVHVKITTLNLARFDDPARPVDWSVARFGASRVLWGSDVTQTRGEYAGMVATARRAVAGLSAADATAVLGGTAARLYGLRPATAG